MKNVESRKNDGSKFCCSSARRRAHRSIRMAFLALWHNKRNISLLYTMINTSLNLAHFVRRWIAAMALNAPIIIIEMTIGICRCPFFQPFIIRSPYETKVFRSFLFLSSFCIHHSLRSIHWILFLGHCNSSNNNNEKEPNRLNRKTIESCNF